MPDLSSVVRCAVHPAVGIARVGNAPADEYYLAPEVPGRPADPGPTGRYKNARGEVRKEAARFRVYGYDAEGKVVTEITAAGAEVCWQVHLANRKPAWYKFANAMDLKQYALSTTYRNATVSGDSRQTLVNDPGPIAIGGRDVHGPGYRFDQGFVRWNDGSPIAVPLGELRTDREGRLLVLGGDGHSASAFNQPPTTFANNEGWYDDVSDGPVRATVTLPDGRELEATPAMVAVTPPNFGPGLWGVVTLYDVVYDLYVRQGWAEPPATVRFWEHVYPLFERMVTSQWVNGGMFFLFGPGSPGDLLRPELLAKLADPGETSKVERERVFGWFRQPPPPWDEGPPRTELPPPQPQKLPPFYGDGFGEYTGIAIDELALTQIQFGWLERWAAGDFEPGERRRPPERLDELPLAAQPGALDRTPLEDCLGGPFHPGIELTWPMRVPRMWRPPAEAEGLLYRLHVLPPGEAPQDDFGQVLTPEVCLGPDGPLTASGPGTLTRWLGIPWQTDEASCLAGYDLSTYLPVPSFWAARVPNDVLPQHAFQQANDRRLTEAQRFKHLNHRQFWLRDLQGSGYSARIANMVAEWNLLGIVAERKPPGEPEEGFPERWWVETERSPSFSKADPTWRQLLMIEGGEPRTERLRKAALSVTALAAEEETQPEAVVHPRRRRIRQDER
jgi:hypothetical protein